MVFHDGSYYFVVPTKKIEGSSEIIFNIFNENGLLIGNTLNGILSSNVHTTSELEEKLLEYAEKIEIQMRATKLIKKHHHSLPDYLKEDETIISRLEEQSSFPEKVLKRHFLIFDSTH